jgi:hypothetical protein
MKKLLLPFLLVMMSACSSLGLQPAETIDQKIAYSYGIHTAVLQTAAMLAQSGTLSKADAAQVLALADQSRSLLDAAKTIEATDAATASNKLALAASILTQLQTYLNSKGVK